MRKGRLWTVLAVALCLAGAGGLYAGLGAPSEDASGSAGQKTGKKAEASSAASSLAIPAAKVDFERLEGGTVSLAAFEGRVVLLNLWGTWCPPCRREIPHLVELQRRIEERGGTVVGLAVDSGSPEDVRTFAEEFGMNYPIWLGSTRQVVEHYQAMGFPTTLLIDAEGVIRERWLGPQSAEVLLRGLEPYLEG